MNHKPQTLTSVRRVACLSALAAVIVATPLLAAVILATPLLAAVLADETRQEATSSVSDAAAPNDAAQPPGSPGVSQDDVPTASALLTAVREKLGSVDSLSCDLHETILLSGMKFSAAGRYLQSSGHRFRLEFRILPVVAATNANSLPVPLNQSVPDVEAKEIQASLTQVSNGSVLYSYWQNGTDVRVTRRNINEILKAAGEVAAFDSTRAIQDLGLGGLQTLIARFQNTMDFSQVRREVVGDTQFLVVNGRWNARIRKELFQLPEDAEVIPQDFIPEYVRLYIDEASRLPRRIQYLKRNLDPAQKQVRPIVTLDLRQIVLNEQLNESAFQFESPEGVVEEDITEQTLQEMRQTPGSAPDGAAGNAGTPGGSSAADSPDAASRQNPGTTSPTDALQNRANPDQQGQ